MLPAERRRRILDVLDREGTARVTDLADELNVSEMTVRRDLDALQDDEALHKVHGGAVARHNRGEEPRSAAKAVRETAEKRAIAACAADLVEDGMTVAVSAGTTTLEVARLLRDRAGLTVVTNSIPIFAELSDPDAAHRRDRPQVVLTGGTRTPSDALVGPVADASLASFRVDVTLLGVHGLDVDAGLTTPNMAEAATNRRLIDIGRTLVVVADHTKFSEVGANVIAPLDRTDTLVVDDGLSEPARIVLGRRIRDVRIAAVPR
ncbi:DeoR/GlpR family DNA-binding transcription regulator [Williamsia deligens]|uniref:DeoR/GlpR family DNA-binding transcription regulator n=1 Tax=Williamsia deligens TaxID=321325 RepID=A0ABW3GCQ3_9NOCA|nr:DeoR/GlpR family DNA-binding transcription regulator [Williamsia deligens]MCP2192439.1 transcriptional regulator, DeoR family [Williamsia deligens]